MNFNNEKLAFTSSLFPIHAVLVFSWNIKFLQPVRIDNFKLLRSFLSNLAVLVSPCTWLVSSVAVSMTAPYFVCAIPWFQNRACTRSSLILQRGRN